MFIYLFDDCTFLTHVVSLPAYNTLRVCSKGSLRVTHAASQVAACCVQVLPSGDNMTFLTIPVSV